MGIHFASFYDISIKLENGGILFCFSFYYLHDDVCTSCLATNVTVFVFPVWLQIDLNLKMRLKWSILLIIYSYVLKLILNPMFSFIREKQYWLN